MKSTASGSGDSPWIVPQAKAAISGIQAKRYLADLFMQGLGRSKLPRPFRPGRIAKEKKKNRVLARSGQTVC